MKRIKVVVIGHITLDEYNGNLIPGGSAYYCSQTYLALGAEVKLISIVGEDFQFNEVFEGIDIHVRRIGNTTHFRNTYKENFFREQISMAQAEPIKAIDIPEDFMQCDILHLAPVLEEIDIKFWTNIIQSRYVAIGLQGWVRMISTSNVVTPKICDISDEEFKNSNIIFLSDQDILNQKHLLDRMTKLVGIVVVTHGRAGYTIYQNGLKKAYGSYSTIEIDPTGAGDVFASGFMQSIASGSPVEEAGYMGSGLASVIVEEIAGNAFNRITDGIYRANALSSQNAMSQS